MKLQTDIQRILKFALLQWVVIACASYGTNNGVKEMALFRMIMWALCQEMHVRRRQKRGLWNGCMCLWIKQVGKRKGFKF